MNHRCSTNTSEKYEESDSNIFLGSIIEPWFPKQIKNDDRQSEYSDGKSESNAYQGRYIPNSPNILVAKL